MFDFSKENCDFARAWIRKLFKNKKFFPSAIYKDDEFMKDAIIKYEEYPYAFPVLEEDQFNDVFSPFEDDKILVVYNFPCYLGPEKFGESLHFTYKQGRFVEEYKSHYDFFKYAYSIAFTVSKDAFDYKLYKDFRAQFPFAAYIDQKSGRTMIALPELNFLIYP